MNPEERRKILRKEAEKLAKKIAEDYKPDKIILFGSAVSGKVTEDSDVDLLVVKDSKKRVVDRNTEVRVLIHDLRGPVPLDVVVFTPAEVAWRSRGGDPFLLEALERGKILYEAK